MAARLFFHETLDPVRAPGAHTRYLEELGEVVRTEGNAAGSAGSRCIAAWAPVFLTGAWPSLVTFWEMPGGWDGFAAYVDSSPDLFHPPLERWYGERRGGFDRVLIGTGETPGADAVQAGLHRAPVVLQQIVSLAPGGAADYLKRAAEARAAIGPENGFGLFGAYEVAFRNGMEAVLPWHFTDMRSLARAEATPDAFPAWQAWRTESRRHETAHAGLVLRPAPWSPLR